MPRFAANLSTMFTEVPLLQRFERAARAGFTAVELQFPYEAPAEAVRDALQRSGLELVLHNLPAGPRPEDRGLACLPGREDEFRASVQQALHYATVLGAPRLHCMAGMAPAGVPHEQLHRTYVANLRHAAEVLHGAGLVLLIEPINRFDMPGYFLNSTAQAIAVLDDVGAPNAALQYDLYHAQRGEGELAATLQRLLPRIGHVQIADNPGRHEPGTGEVNWHFLFDHLDRIGYTGWVGCEYKPRAGTEEGLAWWHALHKA